MSTYPPSSHRRSTGIIFEPRDYEHPLSISIRVAFPRRIYPLVQIFADGIRIYEDTVNKDLAGAVAKAIDLEEIRTVAYPKAAAQRLFHEAFSKVYAADRQVFEARHPELASAG